MKNKGQFYKEKHLSEMQLFFTKILCSHLHKQPHRNRPKLIDTSSTQLEKKQVLIEHVHKQHFYIFYIKGNFKVRTENLKKHEIKKATTLLLVS